MRLVRLLTPLAGLALVGASVTAAPLAQAAVPGVPSDCEVSTSAVRGNGDRLTYDYTAGATHATPGRGDALAWQPKGLLYNGGAGDGDQYSYENLAVSPDGGFYDIIPRGSSSTPTTVNATRTLSGWSDTRLLAQVDGRHMYRLTSTGLLRYSLASTGSHLRPTDRHVVGSAWSAVTTLVGQHVVGSGSTAAEVLLGTTAKGELKEWRVNVADPAKVTVTTLKSGGWGTFSSVSVGRCDQHPSGRVILAITKAGAAYVYFDAAASDGSGADIVGGDTGTRGWTVKAYGQ